MESLDFKNITIRCNKFEQIIDKHSEDFLFLDPPYYLGGDSKVFKGIYPNPNFAIHHNEFDHEFLRDSLWNHRGGFFLTYNNCSIIREWYQDLPGVTFVFPKWQYTYGQGETRVGRNRNHQYQQSLLHRRSRACLKAPNTAPEGAVCRRIIPTGDLYGRIYSLSLEEAPKASVPVDHTLAPHSAITESGAEFADIFGNSTNCPEETLKVFPTIKQSHEIFIIK